MTGFRVSEEHLKSLLEGIRNFVLEFENPANLSDDEAISYKSWVMECIINGISKTTPIFMCSSTDNSAEVEDEVTSSSQLESSNGNSTNYVDDANSLHPGTANCGSGMENTSRDVADADGSYMSSCSSEESKLKLELNKTVEALKGFRKTLTRTVPVPADEFKRKLKELEDMLLPVTDRWIIRKNYRQVSVGKFKKEIIGTLLSCDYNICFSKANVSQPATFDVLVSRVFPGMPEEGRNILVKYFAGAVSGNAFFKGLMYSLVGVHDCYCRDGTCMRTFC